MTMFVVVVQTDNEKDTALYGEPYNAEGFQTGMEAAFSHNGLEVLSVREIPEGRTAMITIPE